MSRVIPPEYETKHADVLIVGSGPIGATYAKKIVDAGFKVLMIEMGAQETRIPGDHKKNVINFQKSTNAFINVIQGELQLLSVPVAAATFPTLDPTSYSSKETVLNGQNPKQRPDVNLVNAAATRSVGGMSAHWTCCTPEPHPEIERPDIYDEAQWNTLFKEAKALIGTRTTEFENSIRQQLVKHTLLDKYASDKRVFEAMPLACKRREDNPDWVEWSASATVFGDITKTEDRPGNKDFELWSEHQCTRLLRDPENGEIKGVTVKDLRSEIKHLVTAKRYVICAGAILTPQILSASDFEWDHPALGRYLTEQTMTFCQIVLKKTLIDEVVKDPWGLGWTQIVKEHEEKFPWDPLPFPFNDPDPQVTTLVSHKHPWHTQIHRDAFSYGLVPDIYDQRTIVDLRFFGYVEPQPDNRVEFAKDILDQTGEIERPGVKDMYGMPQPTFHYVLSKDDSDRANRMMIDMIEVAHKLGGFLPGALPQFMPPGAPLHICGTTRAGNDVQHSVVDKDCRVWGSKNLFLGGCNVIPSQLACNPTLTAICFAIVGANQIINDLLEMAP